MIPELAKGEAKELLNNVHSSVMQIKREIEVGSAIGREGATEDWEYLIPHVLAAGGLVPPKICDANANQRVPFPSPAFFL